MTERQIQIAIKILQYLVDNNNYERDGNVQWHACDGNTEDIDLECDYLHVRDSLVNDYHLIRREGAELHLTPDGEAAQRIGFEKYLRKIKKGVQLELTIKWLDIIDKALSILNNSKILVIVVAGFLGGAVVGIGWLLGWSVMPLVKRIATLLF